MVLVVALEVGDNLTYGVVSVGSDQILPQGVLVVGAILLPSGDDFRGDVVFDGLRIGEVRREAKIAGGICGE